MSKAGQFVQLRDKTYWLEDKVARLENPANVVNAEQFVQLRDMVPEDSKFE